MINFSEPSKLTHSKHFLPFSCGKFSFLIKKIWKRSYPFHAILILSFQSQNAGEPANPSTSNFTTEMFNRKFTQLFISHYEIY